MRIRIALAIAVGMVIPLLLGSPASAKAMPGFIVSGGDLDQPGFVSAGEVADAADGWMMGASGDVAVPAPLGTGYDLDLLQLQFAGASPSAPAQRLVEARWAYHPEAGGALTADGDWIRPGGAVAIPDGDRLIRAQVSH